MACISFPFFVTITTTWRCLEFTSFLCRDNITQTISCVLGFTIDFDALMFVIPHRYICSCSQDYLEVLFNSAWASGRGFRFTLPDNHQIDIYVLLYSFLFVGKSHLPPQQKKPMSSQPLLSQAFSRWCVTTVVHHHAYIKKNQRGLMSPIGGGQRGWPDQQSVSRQAVKLSYIDRFVRTDVAHLKIWAKLSIIFGGGGCI